MRLGFFRNIFLNLLGAVLPLCAGLFAIPLLVHALGVERFGLLNLCWLLVGYFSLFDLGLGRALTRLVAGRLAAGKVAEIPRLVGTAMQLMSWLGIGAAVFVAALSPLLTSTWLKIPEGLAHEALLSCLILAGSLPFVVLAAGWRGVLEAYGRFDLVNWVRVPLGMAIFVAPLLVLQFFDGLVPVVIVLALTRIVAWWFSRFLCQSLLLARLDGFTFDQALLRPLLSFGGWMTVSNLVGPLMVYADRFLIGGIISAAAVAYYATPYEIVTRLWVIPGALTGVLFPIIAGQFYNQQARAFAAYESAMKVLFLGLIPAVTVMFLFAEDGLRWWLGDDFATNGRTVAKILLVGVFVNALGQVAITVLHGAGRADWSAKLHMLELPLYLWALFIGANHYGVVGVAGAWLLRVVFDTFVMVFLVQRLWKDGIRFAVYIIVSTCVTMLGLTLAGEIFNAPIRVSLFCLLLIVCGILLPRQLRLLAQATSAPIVSVIAIDSAR